MYCKKCGKEIDDNAVVCPHCGCATDNLSKSEKKDTNIMAILGFIFSLLFPIVGIVLSIIAFKEAANYKNGYEGLAKAGIIISICWIAIAAFCIIGSCVGGFAFVSCAACAAL